MFTSFIYNERKGEKYERKKEISKKRDVRNKFMEGKNKQSTEFYRSKFSYSRDWFFYRDIYFKCFRIVTDKKDSFVRWKTGDC